MQNLIKSFKFVLFKIGVKVKNLTMPPSIKKCKCLEVIKVIGAIFKV